MTPLVSIALSACVVLAGIQAIIGLVNCIDEDACECARRSGAAFLVFGLIVMAGLGLIASELIGGTK